MVCRGAHGGVRAARRPHLAVFCGTTCRRTCSARRCVAPGRSPTRWSALPAASDAKRLAQQVEQLYSPEANDRFIRISRVDGGPVYVSGAPRDDMFRSGRGAPALGRGRSARAAQATARSRRAADRRRRCTRQRRCALSGRGRHLERRHRGDARARAGDARGGLPMAVCVAPWPAASCWCGARCSRWRASRARPRTSASITSASGCRWCTAAMRSSGCRSP